MPFETTYQSIDEVPAEVRHLFTQTDDGGASILPAGHIKTVDDVSRLQTALAKERNDHKSAKARYAPLADMDPNEVLAKLDRIDELELAANGKMNEEELNKIVETRLKSKSAPLERQIQALSSEREELASTLEQMQQKEKTRTIHDALRSAATTAKVRDTAIDDVLNYSGQFDLDESGQIVTRDGCGVPPGLNPEVWLADIKSKKIHWWPESVGVGASGGSGGQYASNPWAKDSFNLTAQMQIIKQDPAKAAQMKKAAGVA